MLCSKAVSEGFLTTGLTARIKFIGSLVLLFKNIIPMNLHLLHSMKDETTHIPPWLMMMSPVFENQQLIHPPSPSKLS
jgi:hypothetical protein